MATSLVRCRDVTDAAGGTAMLHLGKTGAADGLSLPANLGSGNSKHEGEKYGDKG